MDKSSIKLTIVGFAAVFTGAFCVSFFAQSNSLKFIALLGLISIIVGFLIVVKVIENDKKTD